MKVFNNGSSNTNIIFVKLFDFIQKLMVKIIRTTLYELAL